MFNTNGASQRFEREFCDAVFGEGISRLGRANADSKEDNAGLIGDDTIRFCYYEINLLGDPATSLLVDVSVPEITSFAPFSPVNDTICNWRTFNVTVDPSVNVSWYLNDTLQFTNNSIREANYTLHAEAVGEHNVSAIASNAKGTDMQTRTWNVSSPCFIATAAYGTPLHEDIAVLREFRDDYMMTNPAGRVVVKLYYASSPPIAAEIRENEWQRTAIRVGLVKPLVYVTRMFVG